jgi:transposase
VNKKNFNLPEVVEKDESEIKQIIALIRASALPDEVKHFVTKCIELSLWLPLFLKNKAISLHRLRTIIFGKGYNKKEKQVLSAVVNPGDPVESDTTQPGSDNNDSSSQELKDPLPDSISDSVTSIASKETQEAAKPKKPGHGRMPHAVYEDCEEKRLLLDLTMGDYCPTDCGGKLGPYKAGVIIRIKGQGFAQVYRYYVDKLRCNLCNIIISADLPPEVGKNKYDESIIAMLALMKYFVAIPFYRQENFQRLLNFPLSDATQWYLIEQLAGFCYAVFNELKRCAGNARLLHNDDTSLKILEVIKQIKDGTAGDRTGMYTTGILADYEGHKIALFINGRQHSGENVADLLKYRAPEKDPIIQMSDALSANIPKGMQTILCNCLGHGFRKFDELTDFFGPECLDIVKKLSKVFEYDAQTRNMSHEERLIYHQKWSKPIMDDLKHYMASLLDEKRVEPNGELGKAIKYMKRHWDKLTRFLTVAGAPIDNNVAERMLKIAIRSRKAAMFYKTTYGASIGGMITSLIYTCDLAKQNPLDYLVALQIHQARVTAKPQQWLPWNYRDSIALLKANDASLKAPSPPLDCPAAA